MAQIERAEQVGRSVYILRSSSKRPYNISPDVRQAPSSAPMMKKLKQDDSSCMARLRTVTMFKDQREGEDKHFSDDSGCSTSGDTSAKFMEPPSSWSITPCELSDNLRKEGRDSMKEDENLKTIRLDVKKKYFKENNKVWFGYEPNNKDVPVLVAEVNKRIHEAPEQFCGYRLVQRVQEEKVVSPADDNNTNKIRGKKIFSEKEIIALCNCVERNTDRLLKFHTNILAIMGSDKISHEKQNKIEERACVVIYVGVKGIIPLNEEPFKLDNDDFPLDVREGLADTLVIRLSPDEYSKSVRMGCKIESAYGAGTLAGFLELPNGKIGCLTAWHIFDTGEGRTTTELLNSDNFNTNVFQPDKQQEDKYKIGSLIAVNDALDAALIEINEPERLPRNGNFPNAVCPEKGFPPSKPMKFDTGNIINSRGELFRKMSSTVVKYGARTEITFGNIKSIYGNFRLPRDTGREIYVRQAIYVRPESGEAFSDNGDSGSLVFLEDVETDQKDLRAIGMLVGKLNADTVVVPIWEILKSFGLPLHLLSFDEPWNIGFDQLQAQMKEVNANLSTMDQQLSTMDQQLAHLSTMGQQLAQIADITKKTDEAVTKLIHENTNQRR